MSSIQRVRVALTGLVGLPGVSTFYATIGSDMMTPLHDYYAALASSFPLGLVIQVENTGDVIESTTGVLTGSWIGAVTPPVLGSGNEPYSAPSGAVVNWLTNTVISGRRLRGKTFMVPLRASAYENNGTLSAAFLTAFDAASAAFQAATAANLVVWGRPRLASPAVGTRPAVTARAGGSALVTAYQIKDKAAVLRSRRD